MKISKTEQTRLDAVGLGGYSSIEEARAALIAKLGENDIDGVDEESTTDLIEMYEAFYTPDDVADVPEAEEEAEQPESEEEETEEEVLTKATKELPARKPAPATKAAPAKPAVVKPAAAKPATAKAATTETKSKVEKIDPKNNPADAKYYDVLKTLFPVKGNEYAFLQGGGVTVKQVGKNAKKGVFTFDGVRLIEGELRGNLYLNSFKGKEALIDEFTAGYELELAWSQVPFIKDISLTELVEFFNQDGLLVKIQALIQKADNKLADNLNKMNEGLDAGKAAAPAAKKPVPVEPAAVAPVVAAKKVVTSPAGKAVPVVPAKKPAPVAPAKKK